MFKTLPYNPNASSFIITRYLVCPEENIYLHWNMSKMAIPLHINTAMGHILVIEKISEEIGHFEYGIWS